MVTQAHREIAENGYSVYSHYYNLPNKRVLLIAKNVDCKTTTLKIFSSEDLSACLISKTLESALYLFGIFPNGAILLESPASRTVLKNTLIRLCPNTLSIISTQELVQHNSISIINNDSFFILEKNDFLDHNNLYRDLIVYEWNGNIYKEHSKIKLKHHPEHAGSTMWRVERLKENRYCCHIDGHGTNEFGILIFDINVDRNEDNKNIYSVNEIGVIKPLEYHSSIPASGNIVVLPNGNLLTYHEHHDNIQLWDTATLQCVKQWNLPDVVVRRKIFLDTRQITISPLVDPNQILIEEYGKLFLFDIKQLRIKEVVIKYNDKEYNFSNIHCLINGSIVLVLDKYRSDNILNMLQFDLPEMVSFRKKMTEYNMSNYISYFFLNKKLPAEMAAQVHALAFNRQAEEEFVNRVSDEISQDTNHDTCNCIII